MGLSIYNWQPPDTNESARVVLSGLQQAREANMRQQQMQLEQQKAQQQAAMQIAQELRLGNAQRIKEQYDIEQGLRAERQMQMNERRLDNQEKRDRAREERDNAAPDMPVGAPPSNVAPGMVDPLPAGNAEPDASSIYKSVAPIAPAANLAAMAYGSQDEIPKTPVPENAAESKKVTDPTQADLPKKPRTLEEIYDDLTGHLTAAQKQKKENIIYFTDRAYKTAQLEKPSRAAVSGAGGVVEVPEGYEDAGDGTFINRETGDRIRVTTGGKIIATTKPVADPLKAEKTTADIVDKKTDTLIAEIRAFNTSATNGRNEYATLNDKNDPGRARRAQLEKSVAEDTAQEESARKRLREITDAKLKPEPAAPIPGIPAPEPPVPVIPPAAPDAAPIAVKTIAERDALKPGTVYIDPNGVTRRKK